MTGEVGHGEGAAKSLVVGLCSFRPYYFGGYPSVLTQFGRQISFRNITFVCTGVASGTLTRQCHTRRAKIYVQKNALSENPRVRFFNESQLSKRGVGRSRTAASRICNPLP